MSENVSAATRSMAGDVFEELVERFRNENPTFRISDDVIRRYHLATSTRGFVILCGPSGTGKTWLAQAYANTIGARQKLVAVDPSWSSNEDLLGYLSPLDGFYHHTPFSEFVADSAREWNASNGEGADPVVRPQRALDVLLRCVTKIEIKTLRHLDAVD